MTWPTAEEVCEFMKPLDGLDTKGNFTFSCFLMEEIKSHVKPVDDLTISELRGCIERAEERTNAHFS